MFAADMIAPCGLDCAVCRHALEDEDPCPGCLGPDEEKMAFCVSGCGIVLCEKRTGNGYRFCDECPDFPCPDVLEKENRYAVKYQLTESPLENLRLIRELGMDAFLELEKRRRSCGECGSPVSVQTGRCSGCGKRYGRDAAESGGPADTENEKKKMDQIERISYYESLLNEAAGALRQYEGALDAYLGVQGKIAELEAYYTSDAWKKDFEASESGSLPEGLPCGVLSEDGIDHLLEDNADLLARLMPEAEETQAEVEYLSERADDLSGWDA